MRIRRLASLISVVLVALALAAAPAGAARPTEFQDGGSFDDVDPCTGQIHQVTIEVSIRLIEQGGRMVAIGDRTITTSPTGYVGHGTDMIVVNGQVLVIRLADILRNPDGNQILARTVVVVDLSAGTEHLQEFGLVCLGR